MSNYVWHKVICDRETLDRYFIDYDPFGDGRTLERPYISFNKLFGLKSLNEYEDKIGIHISYGFSFWWSERDDGLFEIKFATRWEYPIKAILRVIELSHSCEWFAVEENHQYVSKFYWANSVRENVLLLGNEYERWCSRNEELWLTLEDCDDDVWYYLSQATADWIPWNSDNGFERYLDTPVIKIDLPFRD